MKGLMQWPNLLPNLEPVLVVICPLCPSLYGVSWTRDVLRSAVRFLNEVAILFTKKRYLKYR
jgi:hypothetical protein